MALWVLGALFAFTAFSYVQTRKEYFIVPIVGIYEWELIYEVNNTDYMWNSSGLRTFLKSVHKSYKILMDTVLNTSSKVGWKLDDSSVFEIVDVDIEGSTLGSMDAEVISEYMEMITRTQAEESVEPIKQEFNVSSFAYGAMYQLVFYGPGLELKTNSTIVSTETMLPLQQVTVKLTVEQILMLSDVSLHLYGRIPENNLVLANVPFSPDINGGFHGTTLFLEAQWTHSRDNAMTGLQIQMQNGQCSDISLVKGENIYGISRCLNYLHNASVNSRIAEVGLLRGVENIYDKRQDYDWENCTDDLNKGRRGGDFLHLCWNSVTY